MRNINVLYVRNVFITFCMTKYFYNPMDPT